MIVLIIALAYLLIAVATFVVIVKHDKITRSSPNGDKWTAVLMSLSWSATWLAIGVATLVEHVAEAPYRPKKTKSILNPLFPDK